MSSSIWVVITKNVAWVAYKQQKSLSQGSGGWTQIRDPDECSWVLVRFSSRLQMFDCVLIWQKGKENSLESLL